MSQIFQRRFYDDTRRAFSTEDGAHHMTDRPGMKYPASLSYSFKNSALREFLRPSNES